MSLIPFVLENMMSGRLSNIYNVESISVLRIGINENDLDRKLEKF